MLRIVSEIFQKYVLTFPDIRMSQKTELLTAFFLQELVCLIQKARLITSCRKMTVRLHQFLLHINEEWQHPFPKKSRQSSFKTTHTHTTYDVLSHYLESKIIRECRQQKRFHAGTKGWILKTTHGFRGFKRDRILTAFNVL